LKPIKQKTDDKPAGSPAKPKITGGRLWLFRFVALLLPFAAVGLLEIFLRITGYGYDTGFLQKARVNGKEYFINNDQFSLRFFPPQLARWPGTLMIPAIKAPDTTRIFIFGESAAMGDPQPAYGASRYLEVLLRERFPGKKFEVINVAFTAINSHVILPIARECAKQDGDIWIIYMGNNEMVGPFGAATVFGSQAPPRAMVKLNLALQKLRVGQLAMAGLRKLAGKSANTSWGGMQMFLRNQIPPNDPRREAAYRNFDGNLHDILRVGLDAGAKVILNTMSVNLRDCPPFASAANTNLPPSDRKAFQELYTDGIALEKKADYSGAAQKFEQAIRIDPAFAEAQFRRAECSLLLNDASARKNYQLACNLDALPFRADSRINAIIRRTADELNSSSLVLSDAEEILAQASSHGITGDELFFEHVHFSFQGNYVLGRLWAERIEQLLPNQASTNTVWASQEACERELGLTPWNRGFVIESVLRRIQQPPLSSQFNNPKRLATLQSELAAIREQQSRTNAYMLSGQALVDAIQRAPQDAFLQEGFANFLEALGDRKQAAGAYRKLLELLPNDFYAKLQLGRLYGELGQPAQGEPLLKEAAEQRPTVPEVWVKLGDVLMAQQKYLSALDSYSEGLRLRPSDASCICYQANALAKLGRIDQAMAAYRRAIQLQPDLAAAHFELAGLLANANQLTAAEREYAEAIRLNPRHVMGRISFGILLAQQGRLDSAAQQFQVVLQLDPKNIVAAERLQQIRARQK